MFFRRVFGKFGIISLAVVNLIPKILLLTFILLMIWTYVSSFLSVNLSVNIIKARIEVQKLLYDKDVVLSDELNIYPGVIDVRKFNSGSVDKIFYFKDDNKYLAIKFTLKDDSGNVVKEVVVNKPHYEDMLARSFFSGEGSTKSYKLFDGVLFFDGKTLKPGVLESQIIIQ